MTDNVQISRIVSDTLIFATYRPHPSGSSTPAPAAPSPFRRPTYSPPPTASST